MGAKPSAGMKCCGEPDAVRGLLQRKLPHDMVDKIVLSFCEDALAQARDDSDLLRLLADLRLLDQARQRQLAMLVDPAMDGEDRLQDMTLAELRTFSWRPDDMFFPKDLSWLATCSSGAALAARGPRWLAELLHRRRERAVRRALVRDMRRKRTRLPATGVTVWKAETVLAAARLAAAGYVHTAKMEAINAVNLRRVREAWPAFRRSAFVSS